MVRNGRVRLRDDGHGKMIKEVLNMKKCDTILVEIYVWSGRAS